jgi:hypothetical protein
VRWVGRFIGFQVVRFKPLSHPSKI